MTVSLLFTLSACLVWFDPICYAGQGREQDYAKENEQALQGDHDAQLGLAIRYGKEHTKKGWYWLRRAAESGDVLGMYWVGVVYLKGTPSIPADCIEARYWFKKASSKDMLAAFQYANLLIHGCPSLTQVDSNADPEPVSQPVEKGLALLTSLAERGATEAMWALSTLYLEGRYVSEDPQESYLWFLVFKPRNVGLHASVLPGWVNDRENNFLKTLSLEERNRVESRAREWELKHGCTASYDPLMKCSQ